MLQHTVHADIMHSLAFFWCFLSIWRVWMEQPLQRTSTGDSYALYHEQWMRLQQGDPDFRVPNWHFIVTGHSVHRYVQPLKLSPIKLLRLLSR